MRSWNPAIQAMADWIEAHIGEATTLPQMACAIGYSPTYCSAMFHLHTGMTLREYTMQRRLYHAAIAIRDTDARLIDIALTYGYSGHEALTAAFRRMYGVTPMAYRRTKRLIPLQLPIPLEKKQGGDYMLTDPNIRVEYIPAHKYLGVFRTSEAEGEAVWPGHDCDLVTHTVQSLAHLADPVVTAHTAGWRINGSERSYFYGIGLPADYAGTVPAGFDLVDVPGGYYQVVSHPPFAYPQDNAEVMRRVEARAFDEPCAVMGFRWAGSGQCYQRHFPEGHGYMLLRPMERV